jgi:hypothetical protein
MAGTLASSLSKSIDACGTAISTARSSSLPRSFWKRGSGSVRQKLQPSPRNGRNSDGVDAGEGQKIRRRERVVLPGVTLLNEHATGLEDATAVVTSAVLDGRRRPTV